MNDPNTARWHLIFHGKVQHVGFRYTAYYFTRELYITGWVKNLEDGSVEMEAQGTLSCLRKFLLKIKGSPHIHITQTELEVIPVVPYERKFKVINDQYGD
ncbi:MAG: acylphosphatase [Sphaerochaetaceae bacterium]|nr:acylphosphatase [Sphaerochaetaceae bacterium]